MVVIHMYGRQLYLKRVTAKKPLYYTCLLHCKKGMVKKMKHIKKLVISVLLVSMLISLVGCGKTIYTAKELVDGTENQQRWLKYPESSLVINPDSVNGTYTDTKDLALNLGIVDGKTVNNAVFFLEDKMANSLGGNTVATLDFSDKYNWFNLDSAAADRSVGPKLDVTIDVIGAAYQINQEEAQSLNFDQDNYAVVFDVAQCDAAFNISMYAGSKKPLGTVSSPGKVAFNLDEALRRGTSFEESLGTQDISIYFEFPSKGNYVINSVEYVRLEEGYQPSENNADSVWAPYSITQTLEYPNTTKATVESYFYDVNTINRKVTVDAPGTLLIGGEVNGTVEYDEMDRVFRITGDGINYVVNSKRVNSDNKVVYYKTDTDLSMGTNGSDDPTGAKYWTMNLGHFEAEETFLVSVAASSSMSLDELEKAAYDAVSSKGTTAYNNLESTWNTFLETVEVKDFAVNLPSK